MTTTKLLCIIMFSALLSPLASAANTLEKCDKKQTSQSTISDYSRCLDGVKEAVDRELQTWVNNQLFNLEELALSTGRTSALNMFKRSQSNFITFRENNCRWQYLAITPSVDASSTFQKCYILVSKSRIKELSLIK